MHEYANQTRLEQLKIIQHTVKTEVLCSLGEKSVL